MKINKTDKFIEVIGHYDNEVQCAKMTLLANLYAIEHHEGYAKFSIEYEDKLRLVDEKLEFKPTAIPPEPPEPQAGPFYNYFILNGITKTIQSSVKETTNTVGSLYITYHNNNIYGIGNCRTLAGENPTTEYILTNGELILENVNPEYTGEFFENLHGSGTSEDPYYLVEDEVVNAGYFADFTTYHTEKSTPKVSVDLTTLAGWSSLSDGSHNITIVARANGYSDSEPSAAVSVEKAPAVVMPVKGDIITLGSKQYRVLKIEGTVAEVLAMYDASTSVKFDSASSGRNNTYAGKNIDTYCNNTFYSDLSAAIKSAIVDKTFTQDGWNRDSSVPTESHYTGKYDSSTYYLTLKNAAYGSSITRHCYCLSVQDVLDYLEATTSMGTSDTTLTDTNIWKMFWNVTASPGSKSIWIRSADSSHSIYAFRVGGYGGSLDFDNVNIAYATRPAFQIDLSKIAWSK